MAEKFRLTLAQLNATVGDLAGNAALARCLSDDPAIRIGHFAP